MAVISALALSAAFLLFVLAGLMASPPAPYAKSSLRMYPAPHDRELLSEAQKRQALNAGTLVFDDPGGLRHVVDFGLTPDGYPVVPEEYEPYFWKE